MLCCYANRDNERNACGISRTVRTSDHANATNVPPTNMTASDGSDSKSANRSGCQKREAVLGSENNKPRYVTKPEAANSLAAYSTAGTSTRALAIAHKNKPHIRIRDRRRLAREIRASTVARSPGGVSIIGIYTRLVFMLLAQLYIRVFAVVSVPGAAISRSAISPRR